jgi:DNA-binding response OmpR family regulator
MAKKVLIIEDRRENIVFIANNILKPEGWDVITARDGELGLQKALEEKPNLIITDLKLPKMHGLDMLEELRKRGFHIPTIVMTFHGSEETAIRAFRLGAADYLIKPFDIEEMLAAIERALQGTPDGQPASAETDAAISNKLVSQEQEIQHLRSLVQQQARTLQELQKPGQQTPAATDDVARWQALLREEEAKLATLKRQTITQHRAMSRQINDLQAQLAEKDSLLASLQDKTRQADSPSQGQADGQDLPLQLAEKDKALQRVNKLAESLAQVVTAHQHSLEKHREEAERVARELHVLAAAIQMLGQDLSDQANQFADLVPGDK